MSHPNLEEHLWEAPILLAGRERQYLVYRSAENELLRQESKGSDWGEPRPLPRQGKTFCAALDAGGAPHLILAEKGGFYHLHPGREDPPDGPFYQDEGKSCSYLLMCGDMQGALHLIYLAVDAVADRWWLLHHRYTGETWEEPRVIDFGGGVSYNYGAVAVDRTSGLHLVYRILEPDQAGLYYRHFNAGTLNWSKALPLASPAAEISYPSIFTDKAQHLHVLWCASAESRFRICYRIMVRGSWPSGGWKPELAIAENLEEASFPFFSYENGELTMAWLEGNTLYSFRHKQGEWEKKQPRQVESPALVRCYTFDPQGAHLLYRLPVLSGTAPVPAGETGPGREEQPEDLDPYFDRLQQYSGTLISRASSLTATKARLEQALEEKRNQLYRLSRENEKTVRSLQQNLTEKDKDLQELENKFNQAIKNLRQKTDQSRKNGDAERKRYLEELRELKKEQHQFEQILKDKESTIARLEKRCREHEYREKQLREENMALAEQLKESGWSITKILGKLLQNKP